MTVEMIVNYETMYSVPANTPSMRLSLQFAEYGRTPEFYVSSLKIWS